MNEYRKVSITSHKKSLDWRQLGSLIAPNSIVTGSTAGLAVNSSVELVLADDSYSYTIKNTAIRPFESIFEQLNSGLLGGALKAAQAVKSTQRGRAPSFNPWFKYAKAWTNTEPIAIPLRFEFKMGQYGLWSAKEEVAKPILALLVPTIPAWVGALTMTGPFQSAPELIANIILKTLSTAGEALFGEQDVKTIGAQMSNVMLEEIKQNTYRIEIGNQFVLDYAYCLEANVSMSTATDQNGFPISGSISMTFEGSIPPALHNSLGVNGTRFYQGGAITPTLSTNVALKGAILAQKMQ